LSLSSQRNYPKVVWLSLHQFYKYHYTTINKVIKELSLDDENELYKIVNEVCVIKGFDGKYQLFAGDTTSTFHSYSSCLEDRGYVYNAMEQISFQKKIKIGYRYSYINISGRKDLKSSHWSVPCSIDRVSTDEKSEEVLLSQLVSVFARGFFSKERLNILALDSGYGTAKYLGKVREQQEVAENLVSIVALRRGRKVWESYEGEYKGKGSPQIYGTQYYLRDATDGAKLGLGTKVANQTICKTYRNSKQKIVHIELSLWQKMKLRTSDGIDMKKIAFSVVRVRQIDSETGEIKGRPLWLAVYGNRKEEVDLWDVFQLYKCRFDIEHYFRFGKQRLLLNDYQTAEIENYNTWHQVVAIAYWFLFAASQDVEHVCMPWENNAKENDQNSQNGKQNNQRKTPAQTQKGMETFISTFENIVTDPKSRNKGKGREIDTIMTKRERYKVVRKGKKNNSKSKTNSR